MAKITGNTIWWGQVQEKQHTLGVHYQEAELELFAQVIRLMVKDGMTMTQIREHFKNTFNIGMSAFYARMKKMGTRWVLPLELRKES